MVASVAAAGEDKTAAGETAEEGVAAGGVLGAAEAGAATGEGLDAGPCSEAEGGGW